MLDKKNNQEVNTKADQTTINSLNQNENENEKKENTEVSGKNVRSEMIYQELAYIIFTVTISVLIYVVLGALVSLLFSWILSLLSLYSWIYNQSTILLWSVFTVISIIIIGFIMIKIENKVEEKLLSRFSTARLAFAVACTSFIVSVVIIYLFVSYFVNFLNFWLK